MEKRVKVTRLVLEHIERADDDVKNFRDNGVSARRAHSPAASGSGTQGGARGTPEGNRAHRASQLVFSVSVRSLGRAKFFQYQRIVQRTAALPVLR
jgi:hypothetical protein